MKKFGMKTLCICMAVSAVLLGGCGKAEETLGTNVEQSEAEETVNARQVKDEGDVEKISEALQVVVDEKRGEMENYLPEQFEIVDKSSVKSKGSYVYLVISEAGDTIVQMIEEEL